MGLINVQRIRPDVSLGLVESRVGFSTMVFNLFPILIPYTGLPREPEFLAAHWLVVLLRLAYVTLWRSGRISQITARNEGSSSPWGS